MKRESWVVETNPADLLHELLAELLGALGHTPPGLQGETGAYPRNFADWKKGKELDIKIPDVKPEPIGVYFVSRPGAVQSSINIVSIAMPTQIGRARVGKECRSRWSPYH